MKTKTDIAKAEGTVSFKLDGKAVQVPKGTSILNAASQNGVHIPTLCYHPKLKPIGSCRVCSVEVEGLASPVMSCATPVTDGISVTTKSPALEKYRADMIRFILVNHPLDCPVCERSGECMLQNNAYGFGITGNVWKTAGYEKKPVVDWGLIRYDENLCIMCERCVSVCREVQGIAAYKNDGPGYESRINTVTGEKLDCDFCGQCISVCPVGALSSGIVFPGRSWEMKKVETVCPHCGVGCSFHINVKKGKIARVTSADGIGHNNGNLCARGRFGYEYIQSGERILTPLVRGNNGYVKTDWDTSLTLVARKLAGIKVSYGGDTIAGIGSELSTNEDGYVMQKFFREILESASIDNMSNILAPEFGSGLFENFDDMPTTARFNEIRKGGVFIYIGLDGSNENPVLTNHIRRAVVEKGAEVAVAFSKKAFFLPPPKVRLVYDYPALNEFILALLEETVKAADSGGPMPGSVAIDSEWRKKLEGACGKISGEIGDALRSDIAELVQATRAKSKPFYIIGHEVQRHPQAAAIAVNIANLARLTGGRVVVAREYSNTQGANDMGVASGVLPGYKKDGAADRKEGQNVIDLLIGGKAKALVVVEEDILARYPEKAALRDAMRNLEFRVVVDSFFTNTCKEADVILPSCVAAEKTGTYTNMEGRVQRLNSAVERAGISQSPWEIFTGVEDKMGNSFNYGSSGEITAEIAQHVPPYAGAASGKGFADYSDLAKETPALKWAEPAPFTKPGKETLRVLPDRSLFTLGVYIKNCPSMAHLNPPLYAAFSPEDAGKFGIKEGDMAEFGGADSPLKAGVRIDKDVAPGTVRVPQEAESAAWQKVTLNGKEVDCITASGMRKR